MSEPVEFSGKHRTDVILVLPIFNEAGNLPKLLIRIDQTLRRSGLPYRIIAVDDGSTDGTGQILASFQSRLPLEVQRHDVNLGLGAAIRNGLVAAARSAQTDEIIVTMDADETHSPSLIRHMIEQVRTGADVAIASRFQPGSRTHGVPIYRRFLSFSASVLLRILFPTPGVRDFTCGYRAYRAAVLRRAITAYGDSFIDADGFQCMVDLLLKLRALQIRFVEVPATLRYDLKKGQSKMRVLRTIARTLGVVVRHRSQINIMK